MSATPWSEHGLSAEEYERLKAVLGREPNRVELGICGAMWSEHCSYKSSRRWLGTLYTQGEHVVQGPGENAGIVRLSDDWCLAFKVESHNHPSFIEPYHGAATGVGGILRDIFTMGARPIANLNSLRFGRPDHERTPYLLRGVVAGIADYGNCVGVPMLGGEVAFAPCYDGNILVNAMTVGLVQEAKIFRGYASGMGNPVFYVGSATGTDGIHGATMASASFDENATEQRPAVQVGDPFTEKLLLEACLELMESGAVIGIQDMGAAGLTSSSFEMAARAGSGIDLHLDRVPMRQAGMGPYELMLSESQERMLVVLERGKEHIAHRIFAKWDLHVAEVGVVTDTGRVRCFWHGDLVADLPVAPLVHEAPKYDRPYAPDPERIAFQARPATVTGPRDDAAALRTLLGHPSLADKTWISDQYDSTVQGNTVVEPGADAGVCWIPEARTAVAVTIEGNSRLVYAHPEHGAQHIIAEGVRNLACVGAVPLGATDCLNFGNPQRPYAYSEFVGAVKGLAHACRVLNVPIVSGNVSFYNETLDRGIWPTPTCGFVGRVQVAPTQIRPAAWQADGLAVVRLGAPPTTLAASAYLDLVHGRVEGLLPPPDLDELQRLAALLVKLLAQEQVAAVHDVAEGGLAVALAEMALPHGIGFTATADLTDVTTLFGEDAQNILVATADPEPVLAAATAAGVAAQVLGTTGGTRLRLHAGCDLDLAELTLIWRTAIPALVGEI